MSFWSRIVNVVRPKLHQDEIREEIEFHLAMDRAEGRDAREARLRLGNPARIREEVRDAGVAAWLDSVLQDGRYALRQFRRSPAFFTAIVLSLAIGIGANTAIFTLADAAILKPLPVERPDELVLLEWNSEGMPAGVQRIGGRARTVEGDRLQVSSVSEAVHRAFAAGQSEFASVAGFSRSIPMALAPGTGLVEQARVQYVSANFFATLGVSPVLGRAFLDEDDSRGQEPALVLSHRYWTSRLGGDRGVLGRSIRVNDVPARIVGVAPPGFFGPAIGEWVDAYAPLSARAAFEPVATARPPSGGENADWWVHQIARLDPGVPPSEAATSATLLFRSLVAETTGTELRPDLGLAAEPGRRGFQALLESGVPGTGGNAQARALGILMLLVGVLLLIICANVANLLLSRAVAQQRESAVRVALGAPRLRLFRQHLVGSGILAIVGGCTGLAIGQLLAHAIHGVFQTGRGAGSAFDLQPDWRVLAYTSVLSIATALLFGLAPAVRAARSDLHDALKAQARTVAGGRLHLPRLLVSMQLALCLAALVAATLLGRSLQNLLSVDLGLEARNLVYATVNPYQAGYTPDRVGPYLDRLKQRFEAIPGVRNVSVLDSRPLQGGGRGTWASTPEGPQALLDDGRPNPAAFINMGIGSPGLLETLGVSLLAGRAIEPADGPNAPVAVVDQRFAEVFFNGRNPVGEHFTMSGRPMEVIGLAANARFLNLREETAPTVYLPFDPARYLPGEIHFALRSAIGPEQLAAEVRRVVASVDQAVPLTEFHTQSGLIDRELRSERLLAFLSGGFGLAALTLGAIGLGGLLAYAVTRRTNEIGVRITLGAAPGDVVRMVLGDALWMMGLGILIGLPAAYIVARVLGSSLYGLAPADPLSAAAALTALSLVGVIAAWIPARRAARVNPSAALRET